MQEKVERLRLEVADRERDHAEKVVEELQKKEQEEQDLATQEHTQSHDDLTKSSVPSSSTVIGDTTPTLGIELIPFIPSKEKEVANLNTIFYDKSKKIIVMRTEIKVYIGEKQGIMVTEKTIFHGIDKDPRHLAKESVASSLTNEDNVDKIMIYLEQYKNKVVQMKETLKKERGEGQSLKRKHEDILSEIEKSREACQILQSEKEVLVLSVNIIEGEKKDLEKNIVEGEKKGDAANKIIEELEAQNLLLRKQLQVVKEKQMDITPFWNQASMMQKEINQVLLSLTEEMYRVKQIEVILKELTLSSSEF